MILENVKKYIEDNNISKETIASKMGISVKKLDRILNTSEEILSCITYKKLVVALGVSADYFV